MPNWENKKELIGICKEVCEVEQGKVEQSALCRVVLKSIVQHLKFFDSKTERETIQHKICFLMWDTLQASWFAGAFQHEVVVYPGGLFIVPRDQCSTWKALLRLVCKWAAGMWVEENQAVYPIHVIDIQTSYIINDNTYCWYWGWTQLSATSQPKTNSCNT